MSGFKYTYCHRCSTRTAHDIYVSSGGYLHSLCTECGKDADAASKIDYENGNATKECTRCETTTEHIRYISKGGYIHWFCCSCGKDIESGASI